MNIWRIHLKPGLKGKLVNQFPFCYERDIIGIGWPIRKKPDDINHYLDLVEEKYEDEEGGGWMYSPKRISEGMDEDENLVWTRDPDEPDQHYLGKTTGDWEYRGWGHRKSEEYQAAEIVSVRPCKLYRVHAADVGDDADDFFDSIHHAHFKALEPIPEDPEDLKQRTIKIWEKIRR